MPTIYLDPGHGGKDPGAVNKSKKLTNVSNFILTEANVVLDIARFLKTELETYGFKVLMSREKNDSKLTYGSPGVSNTDHSASLRAKDANAKKADIFISLHCNASVNFIARGYETYIYTKASKISKELASKLHSAIVKYFDKDRGIKTGNFIVLRGTKMPAVLLELGFITNLQDARALMTPSFKRTIALAIARVLADYYKLKKVEKPAPRKLYRVILKTGTYIDKRLAEKAKDALETIAKKVSKNYYIDLVEE